MATIDDYQKGIKKGGKLSDYLPIRSTPKPKTLSEMLRQPIGEQLNIPPHLRTFWQLYKELLAEGWFDTFDGIMKDNPDKIAEELTTYGRALVYLTKEEKDPQKKYDYFQALKHYISYLSGKLGK